MLANPCLQITKDHIKRILYVDTGNKYFIWTKQQPSPWTILAPSEICTFDVYSAPIHIWPNTPHSVISTRHMHSFIDLKEVCLRRGGGHWNPSYKCTLAGWQSFQMFDEAFESLLPKGLCVQQWWWPRIVYQMPEDGTGHPAHTTQSRHWVASLQRLCYKTEVMSSVLDLQRFT